MVISTPMIIGGAAVLAGGVYVVSKRSGTTKQAANQTLEQVQASVLAGNTKSVATSAGETSQNVVMDAATEEYNMARERYRMITGSYPPRSWTLEMVNAWIEEQSRKEELLKQYVSLVSANATYVTRENTDELTYQQIQSLITKTQNTIDAAKAAERKHKAGLEELCDRFIACATAYPGIGAATLSKYKWDESMLMEIKALSPDDKKMLNTILLEKTDGMGIYCCSYQAEAKSKWKYHKSIPEICGLTINSGRTAASRNGAWACREVVESYKGIASGADGSLSSRGKSVNPVIAFHLHES